MLVGLVASSAYPRLSSSWSIPFMAIFPTTSLTWNCSRNSPAQIQQHQTRSPPSLVNTTISVQKVAHARIQSSSFILKWARVSHCTTGHTRWNSTASAASRWVYLALHILLVTSSARSASFASLTCTGGVDSFSLEPSSFWSHTCCSFSLTRRRFVT